MKKVLFISPPARISLDSDIGLKHLSPNIGLAYVSTFLEYKGFNVKVIDAYAEKLNIEKVKEEILKFKPSFICLSSYTMLIKMAHEIAKTVKNEISKDIPIIVGGYHATACPQKILEEFSSFDFAVYGEGEITLYELIDALNNNEDIYKIRGICLRKDKEIKTTNPRERIKEIDALPFPNWNLFNLKKYVAYESGNGVELPICTSRGCPYQCIFCARPLGNEVIMRSVNNVIDEINRDIEIFGAKQIIFTDETFTLNRKRTIELCDRIIEENIHEKINWICETRADKVDMTLLNKMKKAGCTWINYGIDSGNNDVLNKIKKGHTVEDSRNAVGYAKKAGIKCCSSFILGHPYDTLKTMMDTINLSQELDLDFAAFSILTPYPGTEVAKMADQGIGNTKTLTYDWEKYGRHIGNALSLKDFSRNDLERLQLLAYTKFFLRPSKIKVLLKKINLKAIPIYLLHQIKNSVV